MCGIESLLIMMDLRLQRFLISFLLVYGERQQRVMMISLMLRNTMGHHAVMLHSICMVTIRNRTLFNRLITSMLKFTTSSHYRSVTEILLQVKTEHCHDRCFHSIVMHDVFSHLIANLFSNASDAFLESTDLYFRWEVPS